MSVRIGVYVCHCGLNIAGVINVKELVEYAKTLPNVVIAREYVFMCSAPGQDMIKEDIKTCRLNRVVVASCSPSMHEPTFRAVLADAGLNPYLLEMANIREHSSWVHPDRPDEATEKAKDIIRMAVARANKLEPLERMRAKVTRAALVLGGGVAGLSAAADLAERGFDVYLVEKRPTVGGHAARIGRLGPDGAKGIDVVKRLVSRIASNPRVHLYTNAEVVELGGSVGNFTVKLRIKPRYVDMKCTLCGKCEEVCPVETYNEYEYGVGRRKAIFLPFKDAYPRIYVIDPNVCTFCGRCVDVCEPKAINLGDVERTTEINVGAIVLAIGYDPYEPERGEFGYGESPRVITLFQLERLLDRGVLPFEGLRRVAFISCVGSMGTSPRAYQYCSRMCCTSSLNAALRLKRLIPDIDVYYVHKDIRTYGRWGEEIYWKAIENKVRFLRFDEPPTVTVEGDKVYVDVYDPTIQEVVRIPSDLVVLVNGIAPNRDLEEVRNILKVGCGLEGFVKEAHLKLRPVEALTDGIFLAGTVTGPRSIVESMLSGDAAASKAAALIHRDYIEVEPIVAKVDEDLCSGCGICASLCPYDAISIRVREDGTRVSEINELLCKGCGTCNAACPSGAIQQQHFKDEQVLAQVRALLGGG